MEESATQAKMAIGRSPIYGTRKNVDEIRNALMEELGDTTEYWSVLGSFIHGQCSKDKFDKMVRDELGTNELRHLHNSLLRAIMFNAHFSCIPPPNYQPSAPPVRSHSSLRNPPDARQPVTLSVCTAADLRRLPEAGELRQRIRMLTNWPMTGDNGDRIANMLAVALHRYVYRLLSAAHVRSEHGVSINVRRVLGSIPEVPSMIIAKYSDAVTGK